MGDEGEVGWEVGSGVVCHGVLWHERTVLQGQVPSVSSCWLEGEWGVDWEEGA